MLFLLAITLSAYAQNTFPVRFAHGTEFFPENFVAVRQNASEGSDEIVKGMYPRYIQLKKILNAQERAAFEATGARVIGYVHFGAYLVLLPQDFDYHKIEDFSPRSVSPVKPEWKMARSLREPPYGKWAIHGDYIDLNLQLYPSLAIPEGLVLCRSHNLEVLKTGTQNGFLQIRIHKDRVPEVAALPFVQYLELVPPPGQKEDTRGRSLQRSNLVASDAPNGKKYDGTGVNVLIRDDGQLGPHIDLKGRLTNYALDPPTSGSHGDGVVGIVGGAGNLDPTKKGMAAGADLYSLDYVYDFQDQTLPIHFNQGVTITNSSYSDGCNDGYTLASQTVDLQLFENPTLMHVFSAGNSNGTDCGYGAGTEWGNITGGHKMAKNAIATANVYADGTLETSSSRGPAYDGRIKPDITANGQKQESLKPNNEYQVFGGTSAAAPGIAGCLAQLTQAYRTINGVDDVPSALLKTVLLNTTNEMGNIGPDFQFGWGLVNAWRALRVLEQHQWLEGNADQNGDINHTLQIPAGVKEAKIMLYWAEPPSAEFNARALINDLDLSVNNATGTVSLPWILNPTPNPFALNTPAGKGRDSLNNMEQVSIENPVAGAYTIRIKGTEVPMGPQHYYLVWDFVKDEIKVTYPTGGEGFVPEEVERIHWDAYGNSGTFTLHYSTDGGANFNPITTLGGDRRMYDWTVPNTVSGKVLFMVNRGAVRDTSDYPFSIVPVPQNLQISKVCPNAMTLTWSKINDTLSYDGYLLGNKYMEIKGTSNTNSISIPIQNPLNEQWVSVRASYADGLAGRRALAVYWPGQLLNCVQSFDIATHALLSPEDQAIISCNSVEVPVSVQFQNEGLITSSGAVAHYQVNNNPVVSESIPAINPGSVLDFTFQTPLSIVDNGIHILKVWADLPGDVAKFNDTITLILPAVVAPLNHFFTENFEAVPDFPLGWKPLNPDGLFGWTTTDALQFSVVGPDNLIGRSMHINLFDYGPNLEGAQDYLYMIPINLTGLNNPTLKFDVAHAQFDADYQDGLRIDVFSNCDLNSAPIKIWEKFDPDLATVPTQTFYYYAGSGADWRSESASLNQFAGQNIIVRFAAINDYGNSIYLDNIGIDGIVPPNAFFTAPDSICRLDTVVYQASQSPDNVNYAWSFGFGAIPNSGSGAGPHSVVYPSVGNKTVRLIVTNNFAADTMVQVVNVGQIVTADFSVTQNGLTANFTNSSTFANTYLWDFGDGMNSTETNPIHTYAAPGVYVVTLSASNSCRTNTKTLNLGFTGVNELSDRLGIRVFPNPTKDDFAAEIDSRMVGNVQLTLFDAAGRKIAEQQVAIKQGITRVAFEHLNLPKGLYQLRVRADGKQASFNIAVQ